MFGHLGFASRCAASTAMQLQSVRPGEVSKATGSQDTLFGGAKNNQRIAMLSFTEPDVDIGG
jgi:hypothetical protein